MNSNRWSQAAAFSAAALLWTVLAVGCSSAVVVPRVEGMGPDAARSALEKAGLSVKESGVPEVKDARVDSTDPPAGEKVEKGSEVCLVLEVTIPEMTGRTAGEARRVLEGLGLEVTEVSEYSETVEEGLVSGISPVAGTATSTGSGVTVVLSKGSMYVTCQRCGGSGRITEETDCHNNPMRWCKQYITVCCPDCSGKGQVPRDDTD